MSGKTESKACCALSIVPVAASPALPAGGLALTVCNRTNYVANGVTGGSGATGATGAVIALGSAASGILGVGFTEDAGASATGVFDAEPFIGPTGAALALGTTFLGTTYTAGASGIYMYNIVISGVDNTSTDVDAYSQYTVALLLNGVTYSSTLSTAVGDSGHDTSTLSGIVPLDAGDQLTALVSVVAGVGIAPIFVLPSSSFSVVQLNV